MSSMQDSAMSSCKVFCETNPNVELCMRDCTRGLRAVPISKNAVKEEPRQLALYAIAAVAISTLAVFILYSKRVIH